MTWFCEWIDRNDKSGQWSRLGPSRKTRERAKADAKAHHTVLPHLVMSARYRIVMDDGLHTTEEVSEPPHGWRLRWRWTPLPNARPVRTDGPPRDGGTHEAVVGDSESEGT